MKIPFSYGVRTRLFQVVLVGSVIGHLTFFGAGSFISFFSSPKFSVEEAPSSMEVVLLKEPEIKKEKKIIPKEMMTVKERAVPLEVQKQKEKSPEPRKSETEMMIPAAKGALPQAKPDYFRNSAPAYPDYARRQGWEGLVILKVFVAKDGNPDQVSIEKSSGHQILDEAALKAVKKWRFLPARIGGLSFSSWVRVPIRFVLVDKK